MDPLSRSAQPRTGAFIFRPETESWLGESEVFCDLKVPMLSFTGSGVVPRTGGHDGAGVARHRRVDRRRRCNAVDALLDGI